MFRKIILVLSIFCAAILLVGGGFVIQKKFAQRPDISVIVPSYNMGKTLPQTIDSILAQTLKNWELIIIDDGSTDNTSEILKSYVEKNPQIRVIKNRVNIGIAASLNKGIEMARGKYIARLDADDTSYPERLSRQFSFMEENQLDLASGQLDVPTAKYVEGDGESADNLDSFQLGLQLFFKNVFTHPTIILRKSFLNKHNLKYDVNRPNAEDYDLWLRIFLNGGKLAIMGGKPVTTYTYSGHSEKWWKTSDNSAHLSQMDAFHKVIPDLSKEISEMQTCDLIPLLIQGNKKTGILNQEKLEQFELIQCLPKWEFIHPGWKDHFYSIEENLFSRSAVRDIATITKDKDGVLVKWKRWAPEHFTCKEGKCIKTGYIPEKK